jgi:hypothetical protein
MKSAPDTATLDTIQHYLRPEIKAAILRFCNPDTGGFRFLLGGDGWYLTLKDGTVRPRNSDDYDSTIARFRTLYISLDVFENEVKEQHEPWNNEEHRPEKPIGTFAECLSYTLGADIDSIEICKRSARQASG